MATYVASELSSATNGAALRADGGVPRALFELTTGADLGVLLAAALTEKAYAPPQPKVRQHPIGWPDITPDGSPASWHPRSDSISQFEGSSVSSR
jgi:hypothetical protein